VCACKYNYVFLDVKNGHLEIMVYILIQYCTNIIYILNIQLNIKDSSNYVLLIPQKKTICKYNYVFRMPQKIMHLNHGLYSIGSNMAQI
jgi:hypothetical protein